MALVMNAAHLLPDIFMKMNRKVDCLFLLRFCSSRMGYWVSPLLLLSTRLAN